MEYNGLDKWGEESDNAGGLRLPRYPKPRRPGRRKRVTLIAAFRCYEGAVLCADTLETSVEEGTRSFVRKLEPKDTGGYWVAVAGAGHATLIDGFTNTLSRDARNWPPQQNEEVIGGLIRNVVMDYHENEVRLYPEPEPYKLNYFVVCVKPKSQRGIYLYEIQGTVVLPVGDYSLLGFSAGMYKREVRRLYHQKFPMQTALILGIHLFSLAKDTTSQYIGGDTDAIYVYDDWREMQAVSVADMRVLENRVNTFDDAISRIVLPCSDMGATFDADLYGLLLNFVEDVMRLRGHFLGRPSILDERATIRHLLGENAPPDEMLPDDELPELEPKEPSAAKKKRRQPSRPRKSKGKP
jgi:hypothetical protein